MLTYDKALIAASLHRTILDNMAEALHVLPEELRSGAAVKKVVRHFNDQELLLQQQMAAQGLYRWGANWVSKTDFETLRAAEKEVRVKLEKLEGDYVALGQRITRLSDDIASAERTVARMESDSIAYDASGRIIRVPLPRSYYDFIRDVNSMKAERTQRREEQETMRRQGKQLAQSLPIPQYTGIQRLIEWEGTPIFGNNAARKPDVANGGLNDPLAGNGGPQKPVNLAATSPTAIQPAVIQPVTADSPAAPPPPRPRPMVPIERPSILERAFSEDFPRAAPSTQPLLDSNGK